MPRLVVEKGSDKGRTVFISTKGMALFGRDSSAALQLHDTMSSRLHFRIEHKDDGYWLLDLDSMNGTLVNGQPANEIKLNFGDLIKVGETLFSFLSDDASAGSLTGQRIAGYRIMERIGRGGMGTVYKAEQIDLQRIVALKVLSEENSSDREFIELFVHEARAAAKLNHPNVVQVYDVKHQGNLYFFSMEFVSGGSVQEELNKSRKIPVDQAVNMILDAARGLDYAHSKTIIHRDIKPDNLMISESGSVKIGDLGLARRVDEKVGPDEEHSVIGTPHYIAPEQVLGKPADFRSDIYALGATLYRILSGTTPFTAASVRDLVNKKVREDPQPLHEVVPEAPRRLADLVHRMMARDPGQRCQTVGEIVAELERIRREISGAPSEGDVAATSRIVVSNRKLLVFAVALLVLVVVGGVVGGAYLIQKNPSPPVPAPSGTSDELARRMLENVKAFEVNRMNRNDPDSLRRGIEEYQAVIDQYATSAEEGVRRCVAEARKLKAKLESDLRECLAALELAKKGDAEDVANWQALKRKLDEGTLDLSIVDRTIRAYRDFANRDDVRGTDAAEKARKRENHIVAWKAGVEKWKKEYEELRSRTQPLVEEKKFNEAWLQLSDFQQRAGAARIQCEFSHDRYGTFLFDYEAAEQAKRVVTIAKGEYYRTEDECKKLIAEKKASSYEQALKLLDPVIKGSLDDLATSAMLLRRSIEDDFARWRKEEEDREEARGREQLKRERKAFEEICREARLCVLSFKFQDALALLKERRERISIEPYAGRLARRIEEMEHALSFQEAVITAFKAGRFKKEFHWEKPQIDGTILEFTDAGFNVKFSLQGTYFFAFSEHSPTDFYQIIREGWRKIDPEPACSLVVVCMEFGLYEEALKEIASLKSTDAYKDGGAIRKFCDERERMIKEADSADFEEIEGEKRLARVRSFMSAGAFAAAKGEIDLFRKKFGRTRTFEGAQKEIDGFLRDIEKKSGDEQKRKMKSDRQKAVEKSRAATSNEARKRQGEIIRALNNIDDLFERSWHLGEMYAGYGDWPKSTERLFEAKTIGDRLALNREAAKQFLPSLASVYLALWRNGIVRNDAGLVKQIRTDAQNRFSEGRREYDWWTKLSLGMQNWEQNRFRTALPRLERLLRDFLENPDLPETLWEIATTYADDLRNKIEARGYFQFLLENHPDFPQVRKGECLYRYAELLDEFREIDSALKLYRELHADFPDHSKVKDGTVKHRIEECYRLGEKMELSLDEDK